MLGYMGEAFCIKRGFTRFNVSFRLKIEHRVMRVHAGRCTTIRLFKPFPVISLTASGWRFVIQKLWVEKKQIIVTFIHRTRNDFSNSIGHYGTYFLLISHRLISFQYFLLKEMLNIIYNLLIVCKI